tara:strand:- start:1914 stop:2510 length:597 start_codon:yes stop_codon:yes gene_type:complete
MSTQKAVSKDSKKSTKPSRVTILKTLSKLCLEIHTKLENVKVDIDKTKKSVATQSDQLVNLIFTGGFHKSTDTIDTLKVVIYDQNNWKRRRQEGSKGEKEEGINKGRTPCNNTVSKYFSYIRSYVERDQKFDSDTTMLDIRQSYENRGNREHRRVALYNINKMIKGILNNDDLKVKQIKSIEKEITTAIKKIILVPNK